MNRNRFLVMISILAFLAASAHATIHQVPAQFATLQSAHDAASAGDTILVAPGTYPDSVEIDRAIVVIGSGISNPVSTVGKITVNVGSGGAKFEGLYITGSGFQIVWAKQSAGDITLRRCVIENTNAIAFGLEQGFGAVSNGGNVLLLENCLINFPNAGLDNNIRAIASIANVSDSVALRNCIVRFSQFYSSGNTTIQIGSTGQVSVMNCVFINAHRVFDNTSGFVFCANSIAYANTFSPFFQWGDESGDLFSNNASDNVTPPGMGGVLLSSSPFVSFPDNLHLDPVNGAPCIDTGLNTFTDLLDGTQSDMGIYGGPTPFIDSGAPPYPYVQSLNVPAALHAGTPLSVQATGRIGRE